MTKTRYFKNVTAVLMAVIMMFAALGVTAFAGGSLTFTSVGTAKGYTITITYKDCDSNGMTSGSSYFELDNEKTLNLKFTTTIPSSTIMFFRNGESEASKTFTTPTYVSGMPNTLTTSVKLKAGKYTVGVKSDDSATVGGSLEISYADGAHK